MGYIAPTALTLTDAARATGVSRVTMRRYLDAGRFPNAFRDADSGSGALAPWRIPLDDLRAAGLDVDRPAEVASAPTAGEDARLSAAVALAEERERTVEILRAELTALRELLREVVLDARPGGR